MTGKFLGLSFMGRQTHQSPARLPALADGGPQPGEGRRPQRPGAVCPLRQSSGHSNASGLLEVELRAPCSPVG